MGILRALGVFFHTDFSNPLFHGFKKLIFLIISFSNSTYFLLIHVFSREYEGLPSLAFPGPSPCAPPSFCALFALTHLDVCPSFC